MPIKLLKLFLKRKNHSSFNIVYFFHCYELFLLLINRVTYMEQLLNLVTIQCHIFQRFNLNKNVTKL